MSGDPTVVDILRPITDLFSQSQLQMMLLAWLPLKMSGVLQTNVYVVDMFITTIISTAVVALLTLATKYGSKLLSLFKSKQKLGTISIQVNYYRIGYWGEDIVNSHYTSLAWMISRATRNLSCGEFILMPNPDYDNGDSMLEFSLLPQYTSQCWVQYNGASYHIRYDQNGNVDNEGDNGKSKKSTPPDIIITTSPNDMRNVNWATEFMTSVSKEHREYENAKKERGRWEIDTNGNWFYVLKQHSNRSLESVALSKEHESMLDRDLNTFLKDHAFYSRVGLPYRHGYLFYGKPGTGKTSLINAISAQLNRDVYYMNLRNITSDSMLQSAFSRVPPNQIIVFEDIDAMSRVCHRRDRNPLKALSSDSTKPEAGDAALSSEKTENPSSITGPFTLSCMLNCLDGHILNEGIITIMTSNHPEKFDPALIRAGRIDLSLKLDYADRYQIQRMYQLVVTDDDEKHPPLDESWLATFPENVVPPCECMRVMVLFRRDAHLIPVELDKFVCKYQNGEIDPELQLKDEEEEGYVGSENGQESNCSESVAASSPKFDHSAAASEADTEGATTASATVKESTITTVADSLATESSATRNSPMDSATTTNNNSDNQNDQSSQNDKADDTSMSSTKSASSNTTTLAEFTGTLSNITPATIEVTATTITATINDN